MVNAIRYKREVFLLMGILVLSMSLSSCETLRKKFTRHKKQAEEDQSVVPVLEPEEYPSPEHNPEAKL